MGILMGEGEWFGSTAQRLGTEKLGQEEGTGSAGSTGPGFSLCVSCMHTFLHTYKSNLVLPATVLPR